MSILRKIGVGLAAVVALAVVVIIGWLAVAPPELLRVADGYAAKIVCSNVYLAGRDAGEVLSVDVQAPGNPILKLVKVDVDRAEQTVTARFLGLFATGISLYRPGLGCAAVPNGDLVAARSIALTNPPAPASANEALWPDGNQVAVANPALAAILADEKLTGPGMRAVVVVHDGRIIAETYGPGFDPKTPLLGWSMTKTVNAILLGRAVAEGKLSLDDRSLFDEWGNDGRNDISLRNLLAMTSGLAFNEEYGDVSDATRMLYLEPDMAHYAAAQALVASPGTAFNYSTGTAVLIARLWMSRLGDPQAALVFPRIALFDPLGMGSAVLEADAQGTLVGGSYLYASARDWAKIGQFLLQDGVWNGTRLLPEGMVAMMSTSNGLAGGYSQFQTWIEGPREADIAKGIGLPAGTFWLEGHDGQSIAIIPSAKLIVVRLGLTPWRLNYAPEYLARAVLEAVTGTQAQ